MEFDMPEAEEIEALPTIRIPDLEEGDLLFFSRKGRLQTVFWAVNDIWLHSALVVEIDGIKCTAEVGTASEVFSRPVQVAVDSYEVTAIGRTGLPSACIDHAASWAKSQVGEPQVYAWDDFLVASLVALTRKGLPPQVLDDLGAAMQDVAAESDGALAQSRTCAGFIHEAYGQSGDACSLLIEMSDTRRLGLLESSYSYSGLMEQNVDDQARILEATTLYDLLAADVARDELLEGSGGSRLSRQQFGRALKTVFDIVSAYREREPDGADDLPGAWASPTDLWRSDQIEMKVRIGA